MGATRSTSRLVRAFCKDALDSVIRRYRSPSLKRTAAGVSVPESPRTPVASPGWFPSLRDGEGKLHQPLQTQPCRLRERPRLICPTVPRGFRILPGEGYPPPQARMGDPGNAGNREDPLPKSVSHLPGNPVNAPNCRPYRHPCKGLSNRSSRATAHYGWPRSRENRGRIGDAGYTTIIRSERQVA